MPFFCQDNANQRSRFEAFARAVDEAPAGSVWLATQTITDPEGTGLAYCRPRGLEVPLRAKAGGYNRAHGRAVVPHSGKVRRLVK